MAATRQVFSTSQYPLLNRAHNQKLTGSQWDGIVLVTDDPSKLDGSLCVFKEAIQAYKEVDSGADGEAVVIPLPSLPAKRLVYACTGPVTRDIDDVRRFYDAAVKGLQRALKAGCKSPLLVCPAHPAYDHARGVATMGALHALYVPLEIRQDVPDRATKARQLGVWADSEEVANNIAKRVGELESGRIVARDIGGSDPERMAAPRVVEYLQEKFKDTPIKMSVTSDPAELEEKYPLLAAVNRCAKAVPRHHGRVIHLEYTGEGEVDKTLLLVGKGITYDTGGADIKAGGVMAGMHRDKCGAAAVAGFFQVLNAMRPKKLRVLGTLAMVRNSVGADCYVADELITSRAGVRVRVGNTDAEGRMAMTDPLCEMKERALKETNPELFTIATLTGHAIRAMGPNYSIILDNGPARKLQTAQQMQQAGHEFADPFEISTLRREDFDFIRGRSEYEDVLQCNNQPSSATPRGHQFPAAFMMQSAGLDKYGCDSAHPLPYSHMDIAGSSGPFPGVPTGAPIIAMAAKYIYPRL
ncbi:PREDICTED: putative aminopeptidase W07G4.4 [Branchiostoma belcheri]|uniref:Aminopeptidase W07G4.4 n=1 Tax=Branchiostoma belcheri TaxID=7741 RepID=A0A6P5AQE5_BRABE|nr:PREDICTED: putative aminopeptidase W07G4.4 [Branchiostoma belcheri]